MKFFRFYKRLQYFMILVFISFLAECENTDEDDPSWLSKFKIIDQFCNNIICDKVTECENGTLIKKVSYGGCCDVCVKSLGEGKDCTVTEIKSLRDVDAGLCKKGLKCVKGKCALEKIQSGNRSCLYKEKTRKDLQRNGNYSKALWAPACDSAGNYEPVQQKSRNSICVDENGIKIFGTGKNTMKNPCACSRHIQKKLEEDPFFYIKPQEHCSETGSFEQLQCINDVCYCADEDTGEVMGRMVQIDFLDKLPCYAYESGKEYLKNCEKQFQRSRNITYGFHLKGIELHGEDKVKCDPDGSFAPRQCNSQTCYCTNKEGVMYNYFEELKKIENGEINMTCNCARDEAASEGKFKCIGHGNYRPLQCFSSATCYCVDDDDGDILSLATEGMKLTDAYCRNLGLGLKYPYYHIITSTATALTDNGDDYYDE